MQCFPSPNLGCQSEELVCIMFQQMPPIPPTYVQYTLSHTSTHYVWFISASVRCISISNDVISSAVSVKWKSIGDEQALYSNSLSCIPQAIHWLPLWLSPLQLKFYLGIAFADNWMFELCSSCGIVGDDRGCSGSGIRVDTTTRSVTNRLEVGVCPLPVPKHRDILDLRCPWNSFPLAIFHGPGYLAKHSPQPSLNGTALLKKPHALTHATH